MNGTVKLALVTTSAVVLGGFVLFAVARSRPDARAAGMMPPPLATGDTGTAMMRAGEQMQNHGQRMLSDGRAAGDEALTGHGEHWLRDGAALIQGGRWMAMDPLAAGNLSADGRDLGSLVDWLELQRTVQAMRHADTPRSLDLSAVEWSGWMLRGEGDNMQEHARIMREDLDRMQAMHGLIGSELEALRGSVEAMHRAGGHVAGHGQAMLEYAARMRRGMGQR